MGVVVGNGSPVTAVLLEIKISRIHRIAGHIPGRDPIQPKHQHCRRGKMLAVTHMAFKDGILHRVFVHGNLTGGAGVADMGEQGVPDKGNDAVQIPLRIIPAILGQLGHQIFRHLSIGFQRLLLVIFLKPAVALGVIGLFRIHGIPIQMDIGSLIVGKPIAVLGFVGIVVIVVIGGIPAAVLAVNSPKGQISGQRGVFPLGPLV